MIRIVTVDEHSLVRVGLCTILSAEPDMQVVGEAATGREAVDVCRHLNPDVLILDIELPDIDGFEVTCQVLSSKPAPRVLVLTMHDNEEYAVRMIQSGAMGFEIKDTPCGELPDAVRKVAAGKIHLAHVISERIALRQLQTGHAGDNPLTLLTNRELQVIVRLANGLAPKEIAQALSLSYSTVENYKNRILSKLDLRNISDITRFAIRHRLINKL